MKLYFTLQKSFLLLFSVLFISQAVAQVGINTTNPTTTLDVNGALSLREGQVINNITNNILTLPGTTPNSLYRLNLESSFTIKGINSVAAADGQILTLVNSTNHTMTFIHSNNSLLHNSIYCPSETNLVIPGKFSTVTLQYNNSLKKWIIISYAKASNHINESRKYSVVGTSNTGTNRDAFSDIHQMEIEFTPVNSVVYVTYVMTGDNLKPHEIELQLTLNNTPVAKSKTVIWPVESSFYQAMLPNIPVAVNIGQPVTIKLQWKVVSGNGSFNNQANNANKPDSRYMTIID